MVAQAVETLMRLALSASFVDLCAWDCTWYFGVAAEGYDLEASIGPRGNFANWAFWPALPMLARLVSWASGLDLRVALVVIGKVAFLLSIGAFARMIRVLRPKLDVRVAVAVAAVQPYALYGNVGYTEPLFLLVVSLAIVAIRQRAYLLAGLIGAVGSLVRLPVVFLAVSVITSIWVEKRRTFSRMTSADGLAVLLIPLGLGCFSLFLFSQTGDGIAFAHGLRAWDRVGFDPIGNLASGLGDGLSLLWSLSDGISVDVLRGRGAGRVYYALSSIVCLIAITRFVRTREYDLFVFSLCCTVVPLGTILASMPRYIWWQAPVLLLVTEAIAPSRRWVLALPIFLVVSAFMYYAWFAGWAFVT